MKNANMLEIVGRMRRSARIDRETLAELTILVDRIVNTLGTIAIVLELAKSKSVEEKKRHLRAVVDLAFRGSQALKAFLRQWALVLEDEEEEEKHLSRRHMEDFADIFEEAKHMAIPRPAPSLDGTDGTVDAICEALGADRPAASGPVIGDVNFDL